MFSKTGCTKIHSLQQYMRVRYIFVKVSLKNSTDWVIFKQQIFLFLTDLEAGSPRSRRWQGWILVRPLFWLANSHLLAATSHGCTH